MPSKNPDQVESQQELTAKFARSSKRITESHFAVYKPLLSRMCGCERIFHMGERLLLPLRYILPQ